MFEQLQAKWYSRPANLPNAESRRNMFTRKINKPDHINDAEETNITEFMSPRRYALILFVLLIRR